MMLDGTLYWMSNLSKKQETLLKLKYNVFVDSSLLSSISSKQAFINKPLSQLWNIIQKSQNKVLVMICSMTYVIKSMFKVMNFMIRISLQLMNNADMKKRTKLFKLNKYKTKALKCVYNCLEY